MKSMVLKIIAWLSYYFGVNAFFYRLNCHRKRIITFHNILPDEIFRADLSNGVSNSASSFRSIIREIKKRFPFSINLKDSKAVTITFDDGYLNQYEVAAKILKEEGDIPAILFVAGDLIDNSLPGEALTIDKLLHWTSYAPNGDYQFKDADGGTHQFNLKKDNRIAIWREKIWPGYVRDVANRGNQLLAQLDAQYAIQELFSQLPDAYKRLRLTGVSQTQLNELRTRGWEIGWHTKSHFPLSALSHEEKIIEIQPPKGFEDVVFSYPYGELQSVDAATIEIAQLCGFPCAVANIMQTNKLTSNYFICRMDLSSNKYRLHFRLSGAEVFFRKFFQGVQ